MKFERSLCALVACLLLTAAAGCASRRPAKNAPPKPGTPAAQGDAPSTPAPETPAPGAQAADAPPAAPQPAEGQPAGAPAAAPPTEEKPGGPQPAPAEAKAAEPVPPVAPPKMEESKAAAVKESPGTGGGFDDFMKRTGRSIEETRFLGMRLKPTFSEEIGFTDNVFYQDDDERFVTYKDPDGNGINAFETDGIDNDADGLVDEAGESLAEPLGEESEIFSNLTAGIGLDLPLNSALLSALGQTGQSIEVFNAEINYIEYFKDDESPDAVNFYGHFDLPLLLRLAKDFNRNAFYVRAEGDYSQVTDPLDVAVYQFSNVNPTLNTGANRADFTRDEWWAKATAGWKGARFDAKASARLYEMTLDDQDLQSADHTETEFYAEAGYAARAESRFYVFGELTMFDFDQRDANTSLRDFDKQKAGGGWEGPFLSKKVTANLEGYYLNQEIENMDQGPFLVDASGVQRPFDDYSGPGGLARLTWRPFVTKPTEIQAEYYKDFTWSVVAEQKQVDTGYLSLSHPINERLSTQVRYSVTQEKVTHREHRLYQEAGLRLNYKIATYTEVYFQYTFRHMDSQNEVTSQFSDASNEPFLVRADGDFTANIVSVGISIRF